MLPLKDPSNLQNKLQKHQAFEAELTANKGRVDSVTSDGEKLVDNGHYASDEIKSRVESLQELWKELLASSNDKRKFSCMCVHLFVCVRTRA